MAKPKDPNRPNFKTTARNRTLRSWFLGPKPRPEGYRRRPVLVRLDPQPEVTLSEKPPVRVYLGSEPAQYRAERIFVWSIMQVRDPARAYEIYMMKDLEGFDRSEWKTGFTNYRYAIPGLAGGKGRAIYNDVDQIYLGDPAELFDCDMGGAGALSIDDKESSVMLLDCEKLADLWPIEDVQVPNKHKTFRKRVQDAGLWGYMSGIWNARDPEYVPGESKLLHFTILHAQPWHPFPKELTYQDNPNGEIWYEMERAADAAGFTLFTKEQPSERYLELLEMYSTMHEEGRPDAERTADETFTGKSLESHIKPIAELVGETGAKTILDFGAGKGGLYQQSTQHPPGSRYREMPDWPGVTVTCYDPGFEPFSAPYEGSVRRRDQHRRAGAHFGRGYRLGARRALLQRPWLRLRRGGLLSSQEDPARWHQCPLHGPRARVVEGPVRAGGAPQPARPLEALHPGEKRARLEPAPAADQEGPAGALLHRR